MKLTHVRIVGTGLIGTSIGLALVKRGVSVEVSDSDEKKLQLARDLIGEFKEGAKADLVIIATPPDAVLGELKNEYKSNPQATFIDVSSVKFKLLQEVESLSEIKMRFVATHPMAGRETGGAQSAQGDLFEGRAWIITPTKSSDSSAINLVKDFIALLGATCYEMEASAHDQLMAKISHLPQVLSTSLAGLVAQSGGLDLAGQGLRDMTRLAASDVSLWSEILFTNKEEVIEVIKSFNANLNILAEVLQREDISGLKKIFNEGNIGRSQLSGKHGAKARNYVNLLIVIEDKPGQLSRLFIDCAEINANIEDLAIEHSPEQFTGLITLSFAPEDATRVAEHLTSKSWKVHLS